MYRQPERPCHTHQHAVYANCCSPHLQPFASTHAVITRSLLWPQHHFAAWLTCDLPCRAHQRPFACDKLHFKRLIFPWTDPSLGNCSYLDTCRHMKGCKYIHYELDDEAPAAGEQSVHPCASFSLLSVRLQSYIILDACQAGLLSQCLGFLSGTGNNCI